MKISALKKKLMPSLVASALASGMLMSGAAHAVHVAENGLGQFLISPIYLAGYGNLGHQTDLIVTNTRTDVAVKAKVVVRTAASSTEVLDFIIYLTPGDVWRGTLYRDSTGMVKLRSSDDSIKSPVVDGEQFPTICSFGCNQYSPDSARATFGSLKPVDVPLFIDRVKSQISPDEGGTASNPSDTMTMGHVEVIGVYAVRQGPVVVPDRNNGTTVVNVERTMSKFNLAKIFDTPRAELARLNGVENPAVTRDAAYGLLDTLGQPYPNQSSGIIRSTDPTWVQLNGAVELRLPGVDRMGYDMYALAGEVWDNVPDGDKFLFTGYGSVAPVFKHHRFDGRVIANPHYDAIGGSNAPESAIGFQFGYEYNSADSRFDITDNVIELEHALATVRLQGTYENNAENSTSLVVTFPTRYRHHLYDPCVTGEVGPYFPPFMSNGAIRVYQTKASGALGDFLSYDNSENLNVLASAGGTIFSGGAPETRPDEYLSLKEVNYYVPQWQFESGWFEVLFTRGSSYRAGCSYTGVPAVGLSHKYMNPLNSSLMNKLSHLPELQNRNFLR